MRSNSNPASLADLNFRKKQKQTRTEAFLNRAEKYIDLRFCEQWHEEIHTAVTGRLPYSTEVMLKILLLQQWFGLSDAEAEEQIYDRKSFQNFLDLRAYDDIPDETTICRFRNMMQKSKRDQEFFKRVKAQLQSEGIKVRKGKIVDATITETPKGRKKDDGSSTRDPEASFTKKHGRNYHGYKGHASTDTKGEYIQETYVSTAKDSDITHEDKVLDGDEDAVFEDSAYAKKEKKKEFRKQGKFYGIVERKYRNTPLTSSQKKRNKKIASVRCRGEHPFAELKCRMKYKARYRGREKNDWQFRMASAAYNLKRWLGSIIPAQKQAVVCIT